MRFWFIVFALGLFTDAYCQKAVAVDLKKAERLWAPLEKSAYRTHIKVLQNGQFIELYSDNDSVFSGRLVDHIYQYKRQRKHSHKSRGFGRYFYRITPIGQKESTEIARRLKESGQYKIPTDSLIKGWNQRFLDCEIARFQFKTGTTFRQATYYCVPGQKDSIEFVPTIKGNLKYLREVLQLDSAKESFSRALPRGRSYSTDGYLNFYMLTQRQSDDWDKYAPMRAYYRPIKDTITRLIEQQLNKYSALHAAIDCYGQFRLRFTGEGRLLKVVSCSKAEDKERRKQYAVCIKKIEDACSALRIDFVRAHYGFTPEVSYSECIWTVVDPTMY
jgi:hypothetical protein